ncbi:restriction endonuclease [Desulfatitalea alkaliphila]|uniref:Restriction endonuclease n=1 Tax=Desulfatitalea alkaliphila TaxID=2929485 RepID=A0AA41R3J1_9BACT|nr:restriction endonuclease [Desulfatitalea alkaliphila]MCJ8500126.1 restriction endonuclease [Desulfatitalea alkaliphila]
MSAAFATLLSLVSAVVVALVAHRLADRRARVDELASMRLKVIFQCKKYKGTVTASDIRDFRGAMIGRADKGLFITTGTFTRDAIKEATRDGAPPIDLVDGDQLAEKLKELGLGVKKEMVEKISVDTDWFKSI